MTIIEAISYGIGGGTLAEIRSFYNLRQEERLPKWIKSPFYWVITLLMIISGGGVAMIYLKSGININEIMAIHLGASSPLILNSLTKEKPKTDLEHD